MIKQESPSTGANRRHELPPDKPQNPPIANVRLWLNNHRQALHRAQFHLTHNLFASIVTILVIASTLTLPASFQILFSNLQGKEDQLAQHSGISVFLQKNIAQETIQQLQEQMTAKPEIKALSYLSAADVLAEFQASVGINSKKLLPGNPLPAVIYLTLDMANSSATTIQSLEQWLGELHGVDLVQMDSQWINQLFAIVDLVKNLSLLLALFLIFSVLVIIGNTIRLLAQHYYDEILVSKLMGATDAYVRRPFLYSGVLFGLLGGFFACVFVFLGFLWLDPEITAVTHNSVNSLTINGLNFTDISSILLLGALLGIGGAWIASNRIINEISI